MAQIVEVQVTDTARSGRCSLAIHLIFWPSEIGDHDRLLNSKTRPKSYLGSLAGGNPPKATQRHGYWAVTSISPTMAALKAPRFSDGIQYSRYA